MNDEAVPEAAVRRLDDIPADEMRRLIYAELKSAARRQRRVVGASGTLQTTALVHEAWLRLGKASFVDRSHFMASAALAMRYVIIDHIRAASADKRQAVDSDLPDGGLMLVDRERQAEVLSVHEALQELAELKPRCVRVVECRYFAGYTDAETAAALAVDERTVRRDWTFARAWLRDRLAETAE